VPTTTSEHPPAWTEDNPQEGEIRHVRYDDLVLCRILRWVDGGDYVLRAADFDLLVTDADPREATRKFVSECYSLFNALSELMRAGDATEDERTLLVQLAGPLVDAWQRDVERREKRLVDINFPRLRRRGSHAYGDWRTGSSRTRPKRPSRV
jgi:hypothetical protein